MNCYIARDEAGTPRYLVVERAGMITAERVVDTFPLEATEAKKEEGDAMPAALTKEGLKAKLGRKAKTKGGRKAYVEITPQIIAEIKRLKDELTSKEIADKLGISNSSVIRYW